jgi:hypothetical protein
MSLSLHASSRFTAINKTNMKRTIFSYGFISGIIMMVMMSITLPFAHQIGYDKGMIVGYTTMLLSLSMMFFAISSYKKNRNLEFLSFKQAFGLAFGVGFIGCIFYVLTWLVMYYNFMPNFFQDMMNHQVDELRKSGASQAKIDKTVADMTKYGEMYKNPFLNAAATLMEILPVALLMSLIAGIIENLKKNKISRRQTIA